MKMFYRISAKLYDLLDVIYFRSYENSPRKAVLDKIQEHDRVLDVCTGTGTNVVLIGGEKPDTKLVGIDSSKDMLKVAKNKVQKAGLRNVSFYPMNATRLSFPAKSFDKILISLVLHELDEELADEIILEAKRVLKDDGEMIVTEWEPSRQLSKKICFFPIHCLEPKSYGRFLKKDLYKYFNKHGLEFVQWLHCDYTKVITLRKR